MAIKKSELYSSIWKSCDALRGGMDASQYKDYVLVLLFVKYVSDKYSGDKQSLIEIPAGASFSDMVLLKRNPKIGEEMNKIIDSLAKANSLQGVIDLTDFNDETKLGKGKDMVDRLSGLIEIFDKPELDFSKNNAEGDDLLGDAYEYLMKNFATESGKSKGQFYTPAEVSKIMAKVIGIKDAKSQDQTIYDPTCGSGSLLLKAAAEAKSGVTIYGQEMDQATAALARMNMFLHNNPMAEIWHDNTLSSPCEKWVEADGGLKRFDYVVANPPFSNKKWMIGVDPVNDKWKRFEGFGTPPSKNGDYAFLLHLIKSMKSTGKGAIILPHGVLFRGKAEAVIRKKIIEKGYIKGIIGLPANLFYGTGIPACIIVLDKENSTNRKELFMIDASKGYVKDGNKNRLRAQDIQKIVDAFTQKIEIEKYSKIIKYEDIEKNEYNLNIPRYIDTQEAEDIQNIEAHLKGGIPKEDVDNLQKYWNVFPSMKNELFEKGDREGFFEVKVEQDKIKKVIFSNAEFNNFINRVNNAFRGWKDSLIGELNSLNSTKSPKVLIEEISECLLEDFSKIDLIDKYNIYQYLMDYWQEVMQDDVYYIVSAGWTLDIQSKKKNEWSCDLLPKNIVIDKHFHDRKTEIEELQIQKDEITRQLDEMREENTGDDGLLKDAITDKGTITKNSLLSQMKEVKNDSEGKEEYVMLEVYYKLMLQESEFEQKIKINLDKLDRELLLKFKGFDIDEIKNLLIEDKWMGNLEKLIRSETDKTIQNLAKRVSELSVRYEETLSSIEGEVEKLSVKVNKYLSDMGFEL